LKVKMKPYHQGNVYLPCILLITSCFTLLTPAEVMAAGFTIGVGDVVTTTQTLGNNATGIIERGGSLTAAVDAIIALKSDAIITNIGTINAGVHGIYSKGHNANITNSGTINSNKDGIRSLGGNANITNSGTINAAGYGIYSSGANAKISNSGTIIGEYAVQSGAALILALPPVPVNNITLNLLAGSRIFGRVDLGAGNDTVNIHGGSTSSNLTFDNVENINLLSAGFVDGDKLVTVDATGESSRDLTLSQFTGSVHNLIAQRLDTPLKPVQVATLTGFSGLYFAARKPLAWGQFFGGRLDRDAEAGTVGYGTMHKGVNFGYEWDVNSTRVGLMGGFSQGKTEADTASFKTLTDSYYIGAYGSVKLGEVNLTTSLLAGVSESDNERLVIDNLNGAEVALSGVSSRFFSPSVSVDIAFKATDNVELRPSISVNYSAAFVDDYQETGTTSSNLTVADRTLKVFTTRAQLAAAYQWNVSTELELRGGVSARNGSSDDVDARVAGNAFSYSNAGDENVIGGFVGSRLRIAARDNLNLLVDLELGGDSNERFVNGQVRLDYAF
jgi:hypothetical protein